MQLLIGQCPKRLLNFSLGLPLTSLLVYFLKLARTSVNSTVIKKNLVSNLLEQRLCLIVHHVECICAVEEIYLGESRHLVAI